MHEQQMRSNRSNLEQGVLCSSTGWELVGQCPFDRGAALPGGSIPWSYLFFHVVRLTLQLLYHPVELSNLTLVVPQVITELAPAAVEFLQLLHRKRMMSVHPNRPFPGPPTFLSGWKSLEMHQCAQGTTQTWPQPGQGENLR